MPLLSKEDIIRKVTEITDRVGRDRGVEPVEVELLGGGTARTLRIFIDKPEGVTLEDCEYISQHVGTILDVEDVIPGDSYRLEVSSPGVERKLVRPADFHRFAGQKVKIVLREPVDKQTHWEGVLGGIEDSVITVEAGGKQVRFPLEQIKKANLKFDW